MSQRRYKEVQSRATVQLLPACLDDYVGPDTPVRALDAYVASLDLQALGLRHTEASLGVGHPADDPGLLLKLFLYGYQNKVRRSRALEAETRRNTEVMWLCQGAQPRYKTIADFRKINPEALQAVNRDCVQACRELALIGGRRVAADGTLLKACANPGSVYTKSKLERDLVRLEDQIASSDKALAEADEQETDDAFSDPDLVAKMNARIACRDKKKALYERLEASGKTQVSEVAPDARSFRQKSGTSGVGYNGQITVDDQSRLIVAVDRVQDTNDQNQLEPMMTKAQEAMGSKKVVGVADKGYANHSHIKGCEEKGIEVYVPLPKISTKGSSERYVKGAFTCDGAKDHDICPAGHKLVHNGAVSKMAGKRYLMDRASVQVCGGCPLASRCLSPKISRRTLGRWEHDDVMDRHRARMARGREAVRMRGALVEHPFGTLKRWAGFEYFLMRGLVKCRGEWNLMTLCSNFKRVLNEVKTDAFRDYCRARQEAQGIGM